MLSTLLYDKETWYKYSGYLSSKGTRNYRLDIKNKSKEKISYKWISWLKIENVVWDKVSSVLKNPRLILEEIKELYKNNNWRDLDYEIKLVEGKILQIKNHNKNLLKLSNWMSDETIKDIREVLDDNNIKIWNLESEIVNLRSLEISDVEKENQLKDLVNLSSKLINKLDDLSYEGKASICRLLIDKIVIEWENIEIILLVPIEKVENKKKESRIDLVKEFFQKQNNFINTKIASKDEIFKDYRLCNINGRRRETRTHNPTLPKRVR